MSLGVIDREVIKLVNERIVTQANDISELSGRQKAILSSVDGLTRKLEQLNYNLSLKDDVNAVLSYVLNGAQNATSGRYEKLLTALCQDIIGKRISIKFVTGTSRDRPTLDIKAVNDGQLEDIFDGRGGSVANVVSMGLRFIVLTRMDKLRQFMVLDEADCWIKYEIVHKFAAIVNQMAHDMGVQTLCISHHPKVIFGDANVIKMDYEEAFNRVYIPDEEPFLWKDGQKGIRSIRLHNFMSHQSTELILGPHSNVIVGPNDIGKSAVVRALRAVCYNEGSDDMIRHGKDQCSVTIELEHGNKIKWSRKLKGAHRTEYFMFDKDDNELHHTIDGKSVPSWALDVLGVQLINKFDVQIGHQKRPLFLIDETGSRRAEILTIGKDTQYIQSMCQGYAKRCADDKRESNRLRKELIGLQYVRGHIDAAVDGLKESVETIKSKYLKYEDEVNHLAGLGSVIERTVKGGELTQDPIFCLGDALMVKTTNIKSIIDSLHVECESMDAVKHVSDVTIDDAISIKRSSLSIDKLASINAGKIKVSEITLPEFETSQDKPLKSILVNIDKVYSGEAIVTVDSFVMEKTTHLHSLCSGVDGVNYIKVNTCESPVMEATTALSTKMLNLKEIDSKINPIKVEVSRIDSKIKITENDIHKVSEQDGHCVVCGSSINHSSINQSA